jgi:hypothetical protein
MTIKPIAVYTGGRDASGLNLECDTIFDRLLFEHLFWE